MITLEPFAVYKYYLALKLHFTTDAYDVFKYRGKITANRKSFEKRKDKRYIERISKKFDESQIVEFLVSNFVSGDAFGGVFSQSAENNFKEWKRKQESLSYIFEKDLSYLEQECIDQKRNFLYIFEIEDKKHPILLQAFLGNKISLETLIILNDLHSFIDNFDKMLYNDFAWSDISRLCKKYRPFLTYNKEKYRNVFITRRGN